jgi:hypothetical protein
MERIDDSAASVLGRDRRAGGRPAKAGRTVENIVTLTTSPVRVWSVLTDFANHRHWKPFIQLAGEAVEGGEATYSFRIGGLEKSLTSQADIIRVEKPIAFAWTAGVARLLQFEESYELESDAAGTRLRHRLCFHGFLSGVCAALLRRRFQASLVESDRCLDRHLRRLAAQPGVKPRPAPPRHGGKKTRRRK